MKALKYTVKQYRISCLLATSGPGTKFLPNNVNSKSQRGSLLFVPMYDCSAVNCL